MTPEEKIAALQEFIADAVEAIADMQECELPSIMIAEIEASIDVAEKQIEQLRGAV